MCYFISIADSITVIGHLKADGSVDTSISQEDTGLRVIIKNSAEKV